MVAAVAWRHLYDGNMHFHDDQCLVNYGCNHQRTTASTNFLYSHEILCNAHNTCMSKTTMLDTRISSAAHILMENVTVIFLNTTQAEPLCDRQ